jgi:RNA-directed DNA polymerase
MASYLRQLSSPATLINGWKKLSKKKHSRGFDDQTIEEFKADLNRNISEISAELRAGTFEFTPLLAKLLDKSGGGKRPLKIPAVRDRVVLKAIQLLIDHKFDKYNLPCSFGYIRNVRVADAVDRVKGLEAAGNVWVLEADLKDFFGTVDQSLLMDRFVKRIGVRSLESLIRRALKVEIGNLDYFRPDERELFPAAESGIPQGGVLSPMLANFYLYPFDKAMSDSGFNLVRYADDFVVMCESEARARLAYDLARKVLEDQLRLKIHPLEEPGSKTKITLYSKGFTFLGLLFQGRRTTPGSKSIKKFQEKIAGITDIREGRNLLNTLTSLKNAIEGWGHAYQMYDSIDAFQSLDAYVREQLSSYLRANGLLGKGHVLGPRQRRFLGVPSLEGILQRASAAQTGPKLSAHAWPGPTAKSEMRELLSQSEHTK